MVTQLLFVTVQLGAQRHLIQGRHKKVINSIYSATSLGWCGVVMAASHCPQRPTVQHLHINGVHGAQLYCPQNLMHIDQTLMVLIGRSPWGKDTGQNVCIAGQTYIFTSLPHSLTASTDRYKPQLNAPGVNFSWLYSAGSRSNGA